MDFLLGQYSSGDEVAEECKDEASASSKWKTQGSTDEPSGCLQDEKDSNNKRRRGDARDLKESRDRKHKKKKKKDKKDKKDKKKKKVVLLSAVVPQAPAPPDASGFESSMMMAQDTEALSRIPPAYVGTLTEEYDNAPPLPPPEPIARAGGQGELARNWKQCTGADGGVFYQHKITKQTTFKRPDCLNSFMPDH